MPTHAGSIGARAASLSRVGSFTATTIDVAVHVVRRNTSLSGGNVPRSQIVSQLQELNSAYGGATSPEDVDTGFAFRLISIDRTTNAAWFSAVNGSRQERQMKRALRVGTAATLNLYTGRPRDPGPVFGTATFPWLYEPTPWDDGVVVQFTTLPGGSSKHFDEGDTAVHEVGHWLGLLHTYEGGCEGPNDRVDDTPAEEYAPAQVSDCSAAQDSCSAEGLDPVHNFMSYRYDPCMDQFTQDQKDRMGSMWELFRAG